ncbi:hypothetical protein JDV02_000807 [Purpureocillium takamizusanense]|uniref:Uncharacterized protein n=1 Tax=Purpureocillium takamizusanense TaxID=2060973 RepID=A0A9Q8Q7U1_9HYPO|nr:uncharacterized protein JDV02_000807 [Purpureocillium takamizusanense]UNI14144.1 hypothetical protein JDV02_000807 [Purpureocillium takamizusanense]
MDQDSNMAQTSAYGGDNWVNLSPYSQSPYDNSPMNEYAGFGFVTHADKSNANIVRRQLFRGSDVYYACVQRLVFNTCSVRFNDANNDYRKA